MRCVFQPAKKHKAFWEYILGPIHCEHTPNLAGRILLEFFRNRQKAKAFSSTNPGSLSQKLGRQGLAGKSSVRRKLWGGWKEPLSMVPQKHTESGIRSETLTIPELEQSKASVLNTLASVHSRRSYAFAIDRFIAWYCSEPRLTFNRAVVVRYRSHLESRSLSASTINLHLSVIRRLADESAESGWLTPELAIGIRRVQGVKRLGQRSGNWLSQNQAQELVNAASKTNLRGWRDGAIVGLLFGMWVASF
jgi:hypothetical protein